MKSFKKKWTDEIAELTGAREFQRADIVISLPDSEEKWDWTAKAFVGGTTQDLYTGQARIIGVRWGVQNGGESQANAKTIVAIRFQIPKAAAASVHRGAVVNVVFSEDNPTLEGRNFKITSDMQGSSAATRTCGGR